MLKEIIQEATDRDFTLVKDSPIAGRGVFAKRAIHKGARIIEYKGDRRRILEFLENESKETPNVYVMHLSDGIIIDGTRNGNDARFINHSCEPNCDAYTFDDKVFIYAGRDIETGEELTFDYKLRPAISAAGVPEEMMIVCKCGSSNCRGTLLWNAS